MKRMVLIFKRCSGPKFLVEEWKKLLKWLYADSFSATHSEIRETRAKESGKWLLDDPEFKKWKEDGSEKQLLICTGKGAFLPVQNGLLIKGGSGKSYIM